MLMEMHSLEGMPDEMRKEIKTDLAEVSAIILMKEPSKEHSSFVGNCTEFDAPTKAHSPPGDSKPLPKTIFEDNMIGFVSTNTREKQQVLSNKVRGKQQNHGTLT